MKVISSVVDGFHTDLKLPYYLLNIIDDISILNLTLGKVVNPEIILAAIYYTVLTDKGYSQIRSVKYPFLDESVFIDNVKFINNLNKKYKKHTPYYINNFIGK